jgi:hypothetical protein
MSFSGVIPSAMRNTRQRLLIVAIIALIVKVIVARPADDVVLVKGERVTADVSGGAGMWSVNGTSVKALDVLCIRFAPDPAPDHIPAGVFIRGGSLLTGTLTSRKGENADISSNVFGDLKVKRDDVTAAFFPPPPDQAENMPELSRYASLQAAALGSPGASLKPGEQTRVRYTSGDQLLADRVIRIDSEMITVQKPNGETEPIKRASVRLLELNVPPPPAATPEDERYGPETIVRLKSGDIVRGRVVKLSDKTLVLRTTFMGEKTIERNTLSALFLAGGSNLTWLSSQTPAKAVFTPLFDSDFPARMDASVDGGNLVIGNLLCERGIGVHSKSHLEFTLSGAPAHFVAVVGIDAETKGRGEVTARVLADGKELWSAPSISAKDAPKFISVDLATAKTLTLDVDYGSDGDDSGDHLDWGWAAVVK